MQRKPDINKSPRVHNGRSYSATKLESRIVGRNLWMPTPGLAIALAVMLISVAFGGKVALAATPAQATSGDAVYYSSTFRGSSDIWFVVPGQQPQRALFSARGSIDKDPTVSSDGRLLAFSSNRGGDFEIYVVDLNQGSRAKARRITTNTSADTSPAWSPDSKTIAYVTNRYNVAEIMTIPVGGCARRARRCDTRITKNRYQDLEPAWSPNGRTIVFTSKRSRDRGLQIYTMAPTGKSPKRLTNVAANSKSPTWSPNGSSIAFVSKRPTSRDRTDAIYTMSSNGSNQKKVTSGTSNERTPVWSPDGKTLTFVSVGRRSSTVSTVPSTGGRSTKVMASRAPVTSVSWGKPIAAVAVRKPVVKAPVISRARPTATPRPTSTPVPATPTPTPTPVPPTATPVPPTATSVPPTAVPPTQIPVVVSAVPLPGVNRMGAVISGLELDPPPFNITGGNLEFEIIERLDSSGFSINEIAGYSITPLIVKSEVQAHNISSGGLIADHGGRSSNFEVSVDGYSDISEAVIGLEIESAKVELVSLSSGSVNLGAITGFSLVLTLARGSSVDNEVRVLSELYTGGHQGQDAQLDVVVEAFDRNMDSVIRSWSFHDGLIVEAVNIYDSRGRAITRLTIQPSRFDFGQIASASPMIESFNDVLINRELVDETIGVFEFDANGNAKSETEYRNAVPVEYVFPSFDPTRNERIYEEFHYLPTQIVIGS